MLWYVSSIFKIQFLVVLFLVYEGKVKSFVLFLEDNYKSFLAHFTLGSFYFISSMIILLVFLPYISRY